MEVRRFRTADSTAASAPLSEPSRSIKENDGDMEKQEIHIVEQSERANITNSPTIHQEDEVFEWREVMRGKFLYLPVRCFG